MKKTKALFAAMIIVVVAAASAGLWYLNENGKLGTEKESQPETTVNQQENDENAEDKIPAVNDGNNAEKETTTERQSEEETTAQVNDYEVDDFLSTFSKVYFAESTGEFSIDSCSDYELIMFAYLHIKNTDKSLLGQEERDDDIVYYTTVAYDDINSVIEKYIGVSVDKESVFTENDYEFFRYEDGYFYTPSADGLAYKNICEANYVSASGDIITVEFTVYSGGAKYAAGEAKIRIAEDGMKLQYYSVDF